MREPVVLVNFVKALIVLAVSFGIGINPEQQSAILGLVAIVATFGIGAWIERALVTPIAAPVLPTGTPVTTPSGAPAVVSGASPNR